MQTPNRLFVAYSLADSVIDFPAGSEQAAPRLADYLLKSTQKLETISDRVSRGEKVDRRFARLDALSVDFLVETIGNEGLELDDEMRSDLLQLLLAIANFNERIRQQGLARPLAGDGVPMRNAFLPLCLSGTSCRVQNRFGSVVVVTEAANYCFTGSDCRAATRHEILYADRTKSASPRKWAPHTYAFRGDSSGRCLRHFAGRYLDHAICRRTGIYRGQGIRN